MSFVYPSFVTEEIQAQVKAYGYAFSENISAVGQLVGELRKFHESDVFSLEAFCLEGEEKFVILMSNYRKLLKATDDAALIGMRWSIQEADTEESEALKQRAIDKANKLLIDLYRQQKVTRKLRKKHNLHTPISSDSWVEIIYPGPSALRDAIFKYHNAKDKNVVIDGEAVAAVAEAQGVPTLSKRKIQSWVKRNINRFLIPREIYARRVFWGNKIMQQNDSVLNNVVNKILS